jgi:16S rRNA (uracil1498-N3)-methyltransferase
MSERFFYPGILNQDQTIDLSREEKVHLFKSLRKQPNENVEVINGHSQLGYAKIQENGTLYIEQVRESPPSQSTLTLCIAIHKMNRIDWIIEKGTELGVSAFWLFPGKKSEPLSVHPKYIERFYRLAVAALKQCGRLTLPQIEVKPPLQEWTKPDGTLLFGDTSPYAAQIGSAYTYPLYFFSGPEGGFNEQELALFAAWEAEGVSLHANTLRAETAPIVAAALLSQPQRGRTPS